MALSQYVHLTIQAGTAAPTAQGFGKLLVLSNGTGSNGFTTNEVRSYNTFAQVAEDFESNQFPYQAAEVAFAASPRLEQFLVGLLPTPATKQAIQIDVTNVTSGTNITGSLVSPAGSGSVVLASFSGSQANLAKNLSTAINAFSGISSSYAGNVVTTVAGVEGQLWNFSDDSHGISILDTTADWDYDNQLDNLLTIDNTFYAVAIDNNSAKNMDKVARWASANEKKALFSPQVTRITDFTSALFTTTADHANLIANNDAIILYTKGDRTTPREVAWASRMLPTDPGTATWAFKTLNGVGVDTFTSTEEGQINDFDAATKVRAGNYYKTEAGLNITYPGRCAGGEFIDNEIAKDWLKARISERVFGLFANAKKVPYTTKGANMVRAEVVGVLSEAERAGVIDSGFVVTVLDPADQATVDRAARILRFVEFTCRLAGAIHQVYITGTVTV